MKRHGGTLNAYFSERSHSEKVTLWMNPMIWHSGKGKSMEAIKYQWFLGTKEEGGMN